MNSLTDALKLAEHARPTPTACGVDGSTAPAIPDGRQTGPVRVTRDDGTEPDAMSPAARGDDGTSGDEASRGWRLEPIRATRDDVDREAPDLDFGFAAPEGSSSAHSVLSVASFGLTGGDPVGHAGAIDGSGDPGGISIGAALPSLSQGGDGAAGGDAPGTPSFDEVAPAPIERHSGEAPHPSMYAEPARVMADDAGAAGRRIRRPPPERLDAGESRPATYRAFDARNLPRRRGVVRLIGTAMAMAAVAGVGVGGGYFIWKTELVRPALVRSLPSMSVPVTDLTPVHTANAAMIVAGESDAGAAFRADGHLVVSMPEAAEMSPGSLSAGLSALEMPEESRKSLAVEAPISEAPVRSWTPSNGGIATSEGPEESPSISAADSVAPERVERGPAPARDAHLPGLASPTSSMSPMSPTSSTSSMSPMSSTSSTSSMSPMSPMSSPGHAGQAWSGQRDDPSGAREPAPAAPAVEPIVPVAAAASPGAVDHQVSAMDHAGAEARPIPGAGIEIRKRLRADHVAASLERAYEAFLAGDAESATEAYRAVLGHEPGNRDAHLGLAAVAARAGRWDEAAGHYTSILASHPADTVARAALIAMDEQDPVRGESRLKALLWSEPRAAHVHFNLGNLYAAQSRWPEAQQSYFNAYRFDRRNADYAYNLAVSLDHLSQTESALGLYREALVLSRSRPTSFEAAVVQQRIRDLDTPADVGVATTPPAPDVGVASARPTSETAVTAPAARIR